MLLHEGRSWDVAHVPGGRIDPGCRVRYRLAILDLEGTLVPDADEAVAHALSELATSCGLTIPPAEARRLAGMNDGTIVRGCLEQALGRPASPGVAAHFEAELRRSLRDRAANFSGLRAAAGASDLLSALGVMGVSVAIVSGLDRRTVATLLERMRWEALVHHRVSADDVEEGRPSPAMLHELMGKAGVRDGAEVAMAGDSPHDLAAGFAAGCGLVACPIFTRHGAAIEALEGVRMLANLSDLATAMGDAAGASTPMPPRRGR